MGMANRVMLKKELFEFDSCNERWKYYKVRYPDLEIDPKKVSYLNGRGIWDYKYNDSQSIKLSGDCFFNFNDKKIAAFSKIKDLNEDTKKRLEECGKKHHSNCNCVLMPVTGAMNDVKGEIYYSDTKKGFVIAGKGRPGPLYDRPDTFIYYISLFYEARKRKKYNLLDAGKYFSNSIFRDALNSFNFPILYSFMDSFGSVYEFCEVFYGMDKKFVRQMIREGKLPINDDTSLNRYMDLAEKFWKLQERLVSQ